MSDDTNPNPAIARQMAIVRDVFLGRGWEFISSPTEPNVAFTVVTTDCSRYALGVVLQPDEGPLWCSCELSERVPPRNHRSIAQLFEYMNLDAELHDQPTRVTFDEDDASMTLLYAFTQEAGALTSAALQSAVDKMLAEADRLHDALVAGAMEEAEFRDISPSLATIRTFLEGRRQRRAAGR